MRVRGAQREMSSAERGAAGGGEQEEWRKGGKVFVEVDPISCTFPSCPRFAPSLLSQPRMEALGGFPTSPALAPRLPGWKSAVLQGPGGLTAIQAQ